MIHKVKRNGSIIEIEVIPKRSYRQKVDTIVHWSDGKQGDWVCTDDQHVVKILSLGKFRSRNLCMMDLGFIYVVFDPNSYKKDLPRISFNMAKYRKQDNYVMFKARKAHDIYFSRLADIFSKHIMENPSIKTEELAKQYKSLDKSFEDKKRMVFNLLQSKNNNIYRLINFLEGKGIEFINRFNVSSEIISKEAFTLKE